ncbi:MAG: FixH family protein [Gammaproteobacteria bacterium]|nr:FixH family protein [Gammaproteobacteria bacterium]
MGLSKAISEMRRHTSQSSNEALRNPWVLAIIGIMATFVTVNLAFIFIAFVTSPGLVVEDYYERGRAYEKNALKMMAATHGTRAWETRLDMENEIWVGKSQAIRFSAVDERGLAIEEASVQLIAYRPSDANRDIETLMRQIAPGIFEAEITFPLKGIWDVKIHIRQGENQFELAKRISVLSM